MSRSKKLLYNSSVAILYQIIVMIVGFIIPKVMIKCYGSEINGLVTSITQFISYFLLVEAGLSSASIFALYKPLAKKDYKNISGIVVATHKFYLISGYIFLGLITILMIFYPQFTNINNLSKPEIMFLVLALGCNGIADFFTIGKYRAILTASQKNYIISIASIVYYVINTIIIVICANLGMNVALGRILASIAIIFRSIILILYVKRNFSYINFKEEPNYGALDKRWAAFYNQIITAVQKGTPIIILTMLGDFIQLSVYSIYEMVMQGVRGILDIFINGMQAGFGELIAKNESKTLGKAYNDFEFMYYSVITVIYSVSAIMIIPFIKIYTKDITDANYINTILSLLFVLNSLFYNIKTPQGMMVMSAGLYKETKIQTSIQAAIIIILGFPLAFKWGSYGILIALCISNLYRVIDLLIFIPKYISEINSFNSLKRIILIGIEFYIIKFICDTLFTLDNLSVIEWIGMSIVSTIIATIIVLVMAIIFDRKTLKNVINRILVLLKIKR
ncbi:MAG: Polysaccharide biosynthesis protein C-terminal domain-containing protein [uncultured Clostridium sp.]